MPGFDRTGPQGMGPMTGGARGFCTPEGRAYARTYGYGRGFRGGGYGQGRGMGRGFGAGMYPMPPSVVPDYPLEKSSELEVLRAQASEMKNAIDEINRRITDLEKKSD